MLHEQGPCDATTLADEACLLMPSLTRIVASMAEKGFVTRALREDDRRRQVVTIAPNGTEIIENNLQQATEIAERFEHVLGKKRLDELLDTLKRLEEI